MQTSSKSVRRPKKAISPTHLTLILFVAAALMMTAVGLVILIPQLMAAAEPTGDHPTNLDNKVPDKLPEFLSPDTTAPDEPSDEPLPLPSEYDEVRGIYIASVQNINFPSKPGLSADLLRAELDDIVATCRDAGLNAIYFQVRPSSDALYDSDIFPVSTYLTGEVGAGLPDGFDPLAYIIEQAHENGIALHAWVNPLRVTVGSASKPEHDVNALAAGHPARENPDLVIAYDDGRLYYDCGNPDVRRLIADGVAELAANYDIDGVIFDDYFYPYPVYGKNGKLAAFNDTASYKAHGGSMTLGDFRRDSVNKMIKGCYDAIKAVDADCEFGVAPFGIWQNDDGKNGGSATSGMESYESIYCDPLAWAAGGYVDYLAPQIYWRFATTVARYDTLVRWWNEQLDGTGVKLLVSHGIYNYDTWENPENELRNQIVFARSELCYRGSILYGYASMKANSKGLLDETRAVFSEAVTYTDISSNGRDLIISIPNSGSYIDGAGTFVIGTSDPTEPLTIDGKKVGRTKSGYFSMYLPLQKGKNTFVFEHKGEKAEYVINRGTVPVSYGETVYPTLAGPGIAAVTPSMDWAGSGTLPVTVTAPKGASVTAELDGVTIKLKPTLYVPSTGGYMKEVYSGSFTLTAPAGTVRSAGKIKFTSVLAGATYTAESADIRVIGYGAAIPVEVLADDTALKVETDSWYYDDYTCQSAGMRDNAVRLSGGFYKLRCGGYIAVGDVKELGGKALGIASVSSAEMAVEAGKTVLRLKVSENIPLNCYIENGEFCVTVYNMNASAAPSVKFIENPLFTAVRGTKSTKANAYKYFFKLVDVENFYGFDYYYEDGYLVVTCKNPTALPDSDKPLTGKTIVLDAGHGGRNPGALGPLGAAEGAMNESDFNLEIVMAAQPYLEALGANVIQLRDRETGIDVPVTDRTQSLIEIEPDLVISIHQNSMPYTTDITTVRGLVGLYWADAGYMLTDVMGEVMSDELGKLDRSPTKQRLAMCRNPKFPSTLIETCFITSVEEYEVMMQENTIDRIAKSIADGVLAYYDAQEKYISAS